MVVGWAAGGGTDVIARVYADIARDHFPQPLLVVNKPGAISTIGMAYVTQNQPDGYKVLMATPEVLVAPLLGVGKSSIEDFIPVAQVNYDPMAIVVRAEAPWKTIEEFLAHAKANPEKVSFGTSGSGGIPDIALIDIEQKTGIKFNRIPFQGNAPAIQAALAGQVDGAMLDPSSFHQLVKGGKMRALAISSPRRHSEYPDVPTFRERGVDATMGVWRGIMLPKGTPSNVVTAWRDLTRKITAEPRFQEALKKQNVSVVFEGGDAFKTVLKDDNDIFKRLVPILRASNK
jgi:tripartite-type tricarboxylate transporter receptor subunit TctC